MPTQNTILKVYEAGNWVPVVVGARGESGYSGVAGAAGVSGTSGTSGASGTSGTSGASGASGTSGALGISGTSGASGTSGTSGASGTSGTSGASGTSGTSGASGTSGTSGASGTSGTSGTSGASGTSGTSGASGASGFSGISAGLNSWTTKTTAYTALNGDRLIANTSGGPFTLTLPATPVTGAYVQIADGHNWAANNLTVGRNGSTIESIADDLLLDVQGAIVELVYSGTTWEAYASVGTGTSSLVSLTGTQTLTNKRISPRVANNGVTTSGTITPTADSCDQYEILGLTGTTTIDTPSGTPTAGQKLLLRIKDNGTGRTLNWTTTSGGYRVIGVTLPTTTVASKVTYVGCIYNATDTFWDVVAVNTQA